MPDDLHAEALERGLIRYCPICNGYEVTDRKVAVIGTSTHGPNEAVFLRMYTRDVTLIAPDAALALSAEERERLEGLGIVLVDGPCGPLELDGQSIQVPTPSGSLGFDSVYPALGSVIRSELAVTLGAEATDDGCLVIDAHQRTTVAGLYAAGDIAKGLDQISHAWVRPRLPRLLSATTSPSHGNLPASSSARSRRPADLSIIRPACENPDAKA